jgi:hypothetical protein
LYRQQAHIFDPQVARQNALSFDRPVFKDTMRTFLAEKIGVPID